MPGLFDLLDSEDGRLGLALLAASGPTAQPTNIGQRIAGAVQSVGSQRDNDLRRKLLNSQIGENASQNAYRAAQVDKLARDATFDQQFLGGLLGPPGSAGTTSTSSGAATGGLLGAVEGGGAASVPTAASPAAATTVQALSERYGIPTSAIVADYRFNGGKKIAEMIEARSKPNWTNVNGSLVNTNAPGFAGGIQDGIAVSNDGRATMWRRNPDGAVVMGAPDGALDTYRAFKNIDAGIGSENELVKVYNPVTKQEEYRRRSSVLRADSPGGAAPQQALDYRGALSNLPPAQPGMTSSFEGPPERVLPLIADMRDPQERSNAYDAYSRQMTSGRSGGAYSTGPSADEQADQAGNRKMREGIGGAAADAVSASQAGAQSAVGTLQNVELMRRGLGNAILGPGANVRVSLSRIGQALGVGGRDAAEQLTNTRMLMQGLAKQELSAAGQMKGQGQITESERAILRKAESGDISELSSSELQALIGILERSAQYRLQSHAGLMDRVKSGASPSDVMTVAQPAAPAQSATKLLQSLPVANASNRGQRIRDTTTGKILISNGMQWKEQ